MNKKTKITQGDIDALQPGQRIDRETGMVEWVDQNEAPCDRVVREEEIAASVRASDLHYAQRTKTLGVELQRIALTLAEMGHSRASGEVLRAAVRLGRVKPGAQA